MDLQAALDDAHNRARQAYLRRQDLEQAKQALIQQIGRCEQELVFTDGEIAALTKLRGTDGV